MGSRQTLGLVLAGITLVLCGLAMISYKELLYSGPGPQARRLQKAGADIGPVSRNNDWVKAGVGVVQVLPTDVISSLPTTAEVNAQVQWIGALIRTAKQGGKNALRVLAMARGSEEVREKNIFRSIASGVVSGAAKGLKGGPKGAIAGGIIGGVVGGIRGATGGWGRRHLQWGGSHSYTDPWSGRSMNAGGYLTNPRRSDQIRANNAGALTRSEAQRMGLPFRRKEEKASFVQSLVQEVIDHAENAIEQSRQRLGNNGASIIKVFADDIAAAAAALRRYETDAAGEARKMGTNGEFDLSWAKLIEANQQIENTMRAKWIDGGGWISNGVKTFYTNPALARECEYGRAGNYWSLYPASACKP